MSSCRLAFAGRIIVPFTDANYATIDLPKINLIKYKRRQGIVERIQDDYTLIVHSLIKKETDVSLFERMKASSPKNLSQIISDFALNR